jgi:hypothetical protein
VGTTVSSINKTDRHGITEILLKVMLNTNTQTLPLMKNIPLVDDSVEDIIRENILIPNVAEKNILILVEEKKNNLIQSFCHIT